MQSREASDSEDTYLLRALILCDFGAFESAVDYAFRAANLGDTPIFGEIESLDRTMSFSDTLSAARG